MIVDMYMFEIFDMLVVLIELLCMQYNIVCMQYCMNVLGVKFCLYVKIIKCLDVVCVQVVVGVQGIIVFMLKEVEVFFVVGIRDIFYVVGIVVIKLLCVMVLCKWGCDFKFVVDNVEVVYVVVDYVCVYGECCEVWIEVDIDGYCFGIMFE